MHSSVGINHYAVFYADTHFMPPEAKRKGYRLARRLYAYASGSHSKAFGCFVETFAPL